MTRLSEAISRIGPLDGGAMAASRAHLDRLTKPPGSLGRLEQIVVRVAGITGDMAAALGRPHVVIAAADHGVVRAHGVSAWPSEVTAQMVANFLAGGAAISALAAAARATVVVLDVGVASPIPIGGPRADGVRLVRRPIRPGTADMTIGPAMTRREAEDAIAAGLDVAADVVAAGAGIVGVGEMGIGNTTAASAMAAVFTGRPVELVVGRGAGIDDAGLERKIAAVERALAVNDPDPGDPLGVLAAVGGLEIAALVGVLVGTAAARVPVVLDGFITGAAALVAASLQPAIVERLLAGHRSTEPGHAVVLDHLGLVPLLELELRLGEGTGAALAIQLADAAVRVRDGMATFDDAGVAGRTELRL